MTHRRVRQCTEVDSSGPEQVVAGDVWTVKMLHILDAKFTTAFHYKLKILRIMYLYLSLNWRNFYYDMFFTVLTNTISKIIMIMIG